MQAKVLQALESAGVFTSGGLVKDKVFNQAFLENHVLLNLSQKALQQSLSMY